MDKAVTYGPRIENLRREMAETIPCLPPVDQARAELHEMHLSDLMIAWTNWMIRFIPPRRRTVVFGDSFWKNPITHRYKPQIEALCNRISRGDDLSKFLSTHAFKEGHRAEETANKNGRIDKWLCKDFALNTYNLHHLHLIPASPSGSRQGMSRHLVFIRFYREAAVLMAFGDHKSFDDGTVADAAARCAYKEGAILHGLLSVHPSNRDPNRRKLARYAIGTTEIINDQIVMVSTAVTSGHSLRMVRHADQLSQSLVDIDPHADDPLWINDQFSKASTKPPTGCRFLWKLSGCDLFLVDETDTFHLLCLKGPL